MKKLDALGTAIYFGWNALFMTVCYGAFLPFFVLAILEDTLSGALHWNFGLFTLLLLFTPGVAFLAGVIELRKKPALLLSAFFGVEVPILFTCIVRLALLRELTPATALIAATVLLAIAVHTAGLLAREEPRGPAWALARTAGLVVALWSGALLSFYAVAAGAAAVKQLFLFRWVDDLFRNPWLGLYALILIAFFLLTATLFVASPFAMIALYLRAWWRATERRPSLLFASGAIVVAYALAVPALDVQPQARVLAELERKPASPDQLRARLQDRERLREGLLRAYLGPYRYIGTRGGANDLRAMYQEIFGSSELARAAQDAFNLLASPLLYDGDSFAGDQKAAERLYEELFDQPLQRAERERVLAALSATADRDAREAGLVNVGARKVWIAEHDVTTRELGDIAEIEIHEKYLNRTPDQQEVFSFLSLPASAVITGLWLGEEPDREKAFAFTVSPRGAAQAVYKAEVERRVDPALLEQIGPRQYRLRAFPVPPAPLHRRDREQVPERPLHLWLRYRTFAEDGAWPLPRLTEQRNAYFDAHTRRTLNGAPGPRVERGAWSFGRIAPAARPTPAAHAARMPTSHVVRAVPAPASLRLAKDRRIALILDRSYSMSASAEQVAQLFRWLKSKTFQENDFDLYLTSAASRNEPPKLLEDPNLYEPEAEIWYGGQDAGELLEQFLALRAHRTYEAVIVLGDGGGMDLARDRKQPFQLGAPLWMVHAGGRFPPGYDDATLEAIEGTGGGVAGTMVEALQNLALTPPPGAVSARVEDGYLVTVEENAPAPEEDAAFAPLAARQLVRAATRAVRGGDLSRLDELHLVAKTFGVVTSYSSMIVLVDARQRAALAEAEAAADRFEREVESGKEQLQKPMDATHVSGVPEPETWLLLATGVLALAALAMRRRRAYLPAPWRSHRSPGSRPPRRS